MKCPSHVPLNNYVHYYCFCFLPFVYDALGGACGFGEYGRTVNDANVAGVSRLYKNGTGCGACYQVYKNIIQIKFIKCLLPSRS